MRYRRFGKTDLSISLFSLGTMRCLESRETFHRTLDRALERGIDHLETARGYGRAEELLGGYLQTLRDRSRVKITTKLTPTDDRTRFRDELDDSLKRLGLDYVDCLALHGINTRADLERVKDGYGFMEVLEAAKDAGKIRSIGFSTHAPLDIILETIDTDFFDFVNLHYYYFFRRNLEAIERASGKGMGIFIISPADKGGKLYTPPDTLKELCAPFSPLHLTYRFLSADPRITTLSVGPANPEELDEPLKIADRDDPLTEAEKAAFRRLEARLGVLGTDRCAGCYLCLPCPESINIPEVLRLRNLAVSYDMVDYGRYRYGMFENAGDWFPGNRADRCTECGDCLPRCPEKLEIPRLLSDTHERLKGKRGRRLWEE